MRICIKNSTPGYFLLIDLCTCQLSKNFLLCIHDRITHWQVILKNEKMDCYASPNRKSVFFWTIGKSDHNEWLSEHDLSKTLSLQCNKSEKNMLCNLVRPNINDKAYKYNHIIFCNHDPKNDKRKHTCLKLSLHAVKLRIQCSSYLILLRNLVKVIVRNFFMPFSTDTFRVYSII